MKKIGIDPDIYEIAIQFLQNRRNEQKVFHEAIEKKDLNVIQTLGHRLKGNAGGYGFDELGDLGAQLEQSAKVGDWQKIEALVKMIDEYVQSAEIFPLSA